MKFPLSRRAASEFLGTAFLVAAVLGSGIMGERLAGGNAAIALLANTLATGAVLGALILTFAPISGAHFNPVVTLAAALQREIPWRDVPVFLAAQFVGGFFGTVLTHLMFGLPWISSSHHVRAGGPLVLAEFLATFGLLSVISNCSRFRPAATATAVACYISSAYWFTSSTSFANPAVTLARACSDTFAGIQAADVPAFIASQLLGGAAALLTLRWFLARSVPVSKLGLSGPEATPDRRVALTR
jgi:glycerol uptake facilitator-like aquaporin